MDEFQQKLIRRLDIIIRLKLESESSETTTSITSMVHRLLDYGLSPSEISSIVGKPLNYINALVSSKRSKKVSAKRKAK